LDCFVTFDAMRRDHFDTALGQLRIEFVAVISLVAE